MTNLRYLNQQTPSFWVDNMNRGISAYNPDDFPYGLAPAGPEHDHRRPPHEHDGHGRRGHDGHHGPPGPPHHSGPRGHSPPPPGHGPGSRGPSPPPQGHGHGPRGPHDHHDRRGPSPPPPSHGHGPRGPHGHHERGGRGPRGRGGPCGRGDPHGRGGHRRGGFCGPPPFGRHSHHGMHGGPSNAPFDLTTLAAWIQENVMDQQGAVRNDQDTNAQDFVPAVDVFNTEEAYIVHASLPGAAKEDIAVNWDAASSTLILTGVVHRPGDEDLLAAMEISERKVGAFERKIVLGTQQEPAKVEEDGIMAKLEAGILRVEVPKLEEDDAFVQVKKVMIQ